MLCTHRCSPALMCLPSNCCRRLLQTTITFENWGHFNIYGLPGVGTNTGNSPWATEAALDDVKVLMCV